MKKIWRLEDLMEIRRKISGHTKRGAMSATMPRDKILLGHVGTKSIPISAN